MDNAETVEQTKTSPRQVAAPEPYLDKEGGYANPAVGQAAELAAMRQ
jgi:hypothetical protein